MPTSKDQKLLAQIEELRAQGKTSEEIIETLTGRGWEVREIQDTIVEPEIAEPGEVVIDVREVSKHFKKLKALDKVSLQVQRGSVTALLGPNGAGKTTLVRIMATLLKQTSGTVVAAGFDSVREAQKLRAAIGLAGQYAAVDEFLTGRENLVLVGRLYHLSPIAARQRASELLKQFDLEEAADRILKTYSGGMGRRLDLAASIVNHPTILFLDEPTAGLDPRGRQALWNIIRDLVQEGTTVLLTTQYMEEADQHADKIFVIDHGHIISQGTPDELKRRAGGEILELHVADHTQAQRAAGVIQRFGQEKPHVHSDIGIITMPITGGASVLVSVVRELDSAQVKLSDVMLRRPTLDDVFLKLTGHEAK